ncbi:MAG TPA: VOC family protein [Polyangiaceae bacterium]|nr:VOC family protein [Polyangiaceae bacterium]
MIKSLSHATIYVTDHEQALDFYVKKLGLNLPQFGGHPR